MNNIYKLISDKNFVFNSNMIKSLGKDITLEEFLILIYFINASDNTFDIEQIIKLFDMNMEEVMTAINNLINKKLISLESTKDDDGKLLEKVSLDGYYELITKNMNEVVQDKKKDNVFDIIEKEFERKLTPIESEIINGWLEVGTPEDLIIGAVKEATINGVKTLRYIDKIIYEWTKKGFKTMDDIEDYLKTRNNQNNNEELFDYDWLEDDE